MNHVNSQRWQKALLPSLSRKLCGKEYSSFAHAAEAAQIEEQRLGEAERCTHGEDWEQQKQAIFTNPVKGKPFHLCPDASDYAVGAALKQEGACCGIWKLLTNQC